MASNFHLEDDFNPDQFLSKPSRAQKPPHLAEEATEEATKVAVPDPTQPKRIVIPAVAPPAPVNPPGEVEVEKEAPPAEETPSEELVSYSEESEVALSEEEELFKREPWRRAANLPMEEQRSRDWGRPARTLVHIYPEVVLPSWRRQTKW